MSDAEKLTFLVARMATIRGIAEGGLSDRALAHIARLAAEAIREVTSRP